MVSWLFCIVLVAPALLAAAEPSHESQEHEQEHEYEYEHEYEHEHEHEHDHARRGHERCTIPQERRAIVVLTGDPGVTGNVTFIQYKDDGPVTVRGIISGLSKGMHGFHVHEKGDLTSGCKSTEGHFNPDKKNHGGPNDEARHAGDLGNILADENGVSDIMITDSIISLVGKYSILGRAVVVHSDSDDLGRGGFSDSLTTGHAGTRVACGVIGIQHPPEPWAKGASSAGTPLASIFTLVLAFLTRVFH